MAALVPWEHQAKNVKDSRVAMPLARVCGESLNGGLVQALILAHIAIAQSFLAVVAKNRHR
jgi:hypothetical protein